MPSLSDVLYTQGTISIGAGASVAVGAGTNWALYGGGEFFLLLTVPGKASVIVTDVTDATHLAIPPWQGAAVAAGSSYQLVALPFSSLVVIKQIRDFLEKTEGVGVIYSVIEDAPDPAVGNDGDYALKTNTGAWKQWKKVAGAWALQGTPIGTTHRGDWDSTVTYVVNDIVDDDGTAYLAFPNETANLNKKPSDNPAFWTVLGARGLTGSVWRAGSGAPSNGTGVDDDFYLNSATGDVYKRAAGVYTLVANIRGLAGADGKLTRSGIGAPANSLGSDGDFYIATDTHFIYGPKAGGVWPAGFNLVGASGGTGSVGATGQGGADGKTLRYGSGAPSNLLGQDGDFYIDVAANLIYGPKVTGTWPAGHSVTGPQGNPGVQGQSIQPNATGTLAQRGTYDNQPIGFVFLETDVAPFLLWIKASNTTGDWAGPTPIGGTAPVGDLGPVTDSVSQIFDYGAIA